MILLAEAQHFVRPPDWTWYIVPYFFLAGLAGGCYALATMFRLWGERQDEDVARLGYILAFPLVLICPIPMSLGSWALVIFGLFATVSFIEVLVRDRVIRLGLTDLLVRPLDGVLGRIWNAVGGVLGTFVAGFTGVLLAVSNQPVWSDTWTLGGLFLASGLCGSVALLMFATRFRPAAQASGSPLF